MHDERPTGRAGAILLAITLVLSLPAYPQPPPHLQWSVLFEDDLFAPAVDPQGIVYLSGRKGVGLVALDPSGAILWRSPPLDASTPPAVGPDGTIYVGTTAAGLHAFAPDGSLRWRFPSPFARTASLAIGQDGTIYCELVGAGLHAIDPDGSLRWRFTNGQAVFSAPVIGPAGALYTVSGGHVFTLDAGGRVSWSAGIPIFEQEEPAAIGAQGTIYVATRFSGLHAYSASGALLWRSQDAPLFATSPVVDLNEVAYVGSSNGLLAIGADGRTRWRHGEDGIFATPAVASDGSLLVASPGTLSSIAPDGVPRWSIPTAEGTPSPPTLSRTGTVYLAAGRTLLAIRSDADGPADSAWPMFQHDLEHTARASLTISTSLSSLRLGEEIALRFQALFAHEPVSWTVAGGALPHGLTLGSDGLLNGAPERLGEFTFELRGTDRNGRTALKRFVVEVVLTLPPALVRIDKAGPAAVPGRVLEYQVALFNSSPFFATNLLVSELLDSDFELVSVDPPGLFGLADQKAASMVLWEVPSLAPGEIRVMRYRVRLAPTRPLGSTIAAGPACSEPHFLDLAACWLGVYRDLLLPPCDLACFLTCECLVGVTTCLRNRNLLSCFDRFKCFADCQGCFSTCTEHVQEKFRNCLEATTGSCDVHEQEVVGPVDPNEKVALVAPYIGPARPIPFAIHYENVGNAEALDVFISDALDPHLDIKSVEILTPGGRVDEATRQVVWELLQRNLQPGETDSVAFSVAPLPDLPSGTRIRNSASIQFEIFEPLVTDEVTITIDRTPPSCRMDPLPALTASSDFDISWRTEDEVGEVAHVTIYASVDGSGFKPLLTNTRRQRSLFQGSPGHTYEFFCVAVDVAGNVESKQPVAETRTHVSAGESCSPGVDALCLAGGRFRVTARWESPQGASGTGLARPLTGDTGYFWFFDPDNVEIVIKVLDACSFTDRFWVFAAGLTNVEVELVVTDTITGIAKTYLNPQGTPLSPIQDTDAFTTCTASSAPTSLAAGLAGAALGLAGPAREGAVRRLANAPGANDQTTGETTRGEAVLAQGRFRVSLDWKTAQGTAGTGIPVAITDDTAYFWFFDEQNVEVVIKIVEACTPEFDRYWVFVAGLTDVEVEIRVEDASTGDTRGYVNPLGTPFQPIQDTDAFATCP